MLGILETIGNFFESLWDLLTSLVDFVIGFVEDLVFVIGQAGESLAKTSNLFLGILPSTISGLLVGILSAVVIYKIVGRE